MPRITKLILLMFLSMSGSLLNAHTNSNSYITIYDQSALEDTYSSGQWRINVQDLEYLYGIDLDRNGEITWGEFKASMTYTLPKLATQLSLVSADGECAINFNDPKIQHTGIDTWAILDFSSQCPDNAPLSEIYYQFLFSEDTNHRGILAWNGQVQVASPENRKVTSPQTSTHFVTLAPQFFIEGIWHIWIGWDHLLFLFVLIMAIYFSKKQTSTSPLNRTIQLITAFTIAHSITLIAATLGWVNISIHLIELYIAVSVILAGLLLFFPISILPEWSIAFIFGLIHGFGFANVLQQLELPSQHFFTALLTFNLGIEAGQILILIALLPLLKFAASKAQLHQYAISTTAVISISIGSYWAWERASIFLN